MSIRPSEASRFSLRAVVAEEAPADRKFVLNGAVHNPEPSNVEFGGGMGLRFDFSSLQVQKPAADAAQRGTPFIAPMKNAFHVSNESSNADVIRLGIMVEDLNSRAKRASDRATTAETQLQRTQVALRNERNNNASRINAVSLELASARAAESHIRAKLTSAVSNASKQAVKVDKFGSAVASALEADKTTEETRKQIESMRLEDSKNKGRMDTMASELIEMHSKNTAAKVSIEKLGERIAATESELDAAKKSEAAAVAERDAAKRETLEALEKATATDALAVQLRQQAESARATSCCADSAHVEQQVEPVEVAPAQPDSTPPLQRPSFPDPIKMHKKYQVMRQNVLALSQKIVDAAHDGLDEGALSDLSKKRDAAYLKALDYKHRYDTIFGAVENDKSIPDGTIHEAKSVESTNNQAPVGYRVFGDAPDSRFPNVCGDAYKEACTPRFGTPVYMGRVDCAQNIGSVQLSAHTLEMSVDAGDAAPTGNHDAKGDMINSVISDLKAFLVDAKERDEKAYSEAYSVAMRVGTL